MASWTSALTGFIGGAANAATSYPPAPDPTFSSNSANSVATTAFQQPAVAFGVPAGLEHILMPHVHINVPATPAANELHYFVSNGRQ